MSRACTTFRAGLVALVLASAVAVVYAPSGSPAASAPRAAHVSTAILPAPPRPPVPDRHPVVLDTSAVVVAARAGVQVFAGPDGAPRMHLAGKTDLGTVQTLLTTGSEGGWWEVALPTRPNGNTGWVRGSDVTAATISTRLEVDRATHQLSLLRDGKVVSRFPVAVGTSATPTPAGRFYVTDNLDTHNPAGAYGPFALGLSGHSDVLLRFGSGDGVLGIHGTNETDSIGHNATHGCIRLHNADITTLVAQVPLGTPVVVT